jgi:glycosyltransferase involved in cell wall biosynthesis
MRDEIFLTIGIPTYLRENSLIQLLDQIAETIPTSACEILIINNGEIINIEKQIDKLSVSKYKVRIINNLKNCGGQENVLRIYENSRSKYTWFLGDDDRLYPNTLNSVIEKLKQNSCDCLLFDSDAADHPEIKLNQGYHNSNIIFSGIIPLRKLMFAPLAIIRTESVTKALPYARLSLGCFAPQLLLILLGDIDKFYYMKEKIIMCEKSEININQKLSILPVFLGIGNLSKIKTVSVNKYSLKKLIKAEWVYYLRPRGIIVSLVVSKLQGKSTSIMDFTFAGFRNYPLWLAAIFSLILLLISLMPNSIIKIIYNIMAKILDKKTGYEVYYSNDRI